MTNLPDDIFEGDLLCLPMGIVESCSRSEYEDEESLLQYCGPLPTTRSEYLKRKKKRWELIEDKTDDMVF